jgi:DNA-binding winged helix-turn-helix (wHTH) protein/TolB-like protein
MARPARESRLCFGLFELDVAAGELHRDGVRVRLQEQPRQVLAALLERPGEVVTRDELRERLWKNDTFVDFDHGLNTAIKKVRQALGDAAENPRFVETLARRGYRFIAPVGSALDPTPSPALPEPMTPTAPSPTADPPAPEPPRRRGRRWWIAATSVVTLLAAAFWLGRAIRPGVAPATLQPRSVVQLAVLPLRVLAPTSPDEQSLGVGIADAITTRLANLRQLALRPTSAVLPYAQDGADLRAVGAALGVEHLLVGTIQRASSEYRVSVQLVRARDVVAVWGHAYDVAVPDLLRLQDTVAEQIADALQLELTPAERERLRRPYTENAAAYDLYLHGRALLVNYNDAKMRDAIGNFERAIALDSRFALAHAGLATACAWFSVRFAYEPDAVQWGKRAEEEARKALAEDPSLAEAHLAIAHAAGTQYRGFNWNVVFRETAAALELDASLDLAHVARVRAYYHLGLFDEASREARLARALNPNPSIETERLEVALHLYRGDFERAAERASGLLKRTDAPAIRYYLGLAWYYLGDTAAAIAMLATVQRGGQLDVRSQAALASVEAAIGARDDAHRRIERIVGGPYMDHHVAYSVAATYAQLGDADASIVWLMQAADTGFPCTPWFERDTLLAPVRKDDRFVQLVARLRTSAPHGEMPPTAP